MVVSNLRTMRSFYSLVTPFFLVKIARMAASEIILEWFNKTIYEQPRRVLLEGLCFVRFAC